ncbi:MAG: hypothetical protein EZS28_038993, partial [Streblomastix strix]
FRADFGLARVLRDGRTLYFAPEILIAQNQQQKKKQRFAADIWACGIMFYELLAHHHPFVQNQKNISIVELSDMVLNNFPPELPAHYPENMKKLIMQMLEKDPKKRITAEQIYADPDFDPNSLLYLHCELLLVVPRLEHTSTFVISRLLHTRDRQENRLQRWVRTK